MLEPTVMTGKQVEEAYKNGTWEHTAFNEVRQIVQDVAFPCHFAQISDLVGSTYYAFTNSATEAGDCEQVARHLTEFTNVVKISRRGKRYVLLLVFKPEDLSRDNEYYAEVFWRLLDYLHDHDREPWPQRVSTDPNDGDFAFCFNGMVFFTFANTPAYRRRRSRNLGESLVIVFVPSSAFSGIKLLTPGGIAARQQIRQRLERYDNEEHFPDFGMVDEGIPLAWKSYFIPDENIPLTTECPFTFRDAHVIELHDEDTA